MAEINTFGIFDFTEGVRNSRQNLIVPAGKFLYDGANCEVSGQFLKTRLGSYTCSSEILADGVVEYVRQVTFPSTQKTFLLAQVRSSTACKLYASNTALPSNSVSFTEVYDLGATAGTVSISPIGDRAIIAEGIVNAPLVFLGGMTSTGADWVLPLKVFGTLDGSYYFDMTANLTDSDSDTKYTLNAMPTAGGIYIAFDVRTLSGLYFEVETPNATICDLLLWRWTGLNGWPLR